MSAEGSAVHGGGLPSEPARRDFLKLVTMATAAIGGAAVAWAFIDSMNPAADVIAAGAPMDIDVSKVAAGQQIVILWRGSPILVVNRTPDALKTLQQPSLVGRLSDPNSSCRAAAQLRPQLASVDPARVRGAGRHLHASGLPAILLSRAEPDGTGGRLAGRIFLPLSRLEIRSGGSRLFGGAGAVQSACAALSFPQRAHPAHRRKSARRDVHAKLGRADVATAEMNKV